MRVAGVPAVPLGVRLGVRLDGPEYRVCASGLPVGGGAVALVRAVLPDARSLGFVRSFVCLFVCLEPSFVVVPCAAAGPAPVRRQLARKVHWGYSGYSHTGHVGPVPAGYGRTRTHSRHAQCTRAHPRVPMLTSRTHLGMLVRTHAHTTHDNRRTRTHIAPTRTHARTYTRGRTHAHAHTRTHTHTTRARAHAHARTGTGIHTRTHTHTHAYTRIHTHTTRARARTRTRAYRHTQRV